MKGGSKYLAALILILAYLPASAFTQDALKPKYKLDAGQRRVVELSNLSQQDDCHPARLVGKVVKRKFDDRVGTVVTGVTIEQSDGTRSFANIAVAENENWALDIGRANAAWIVQGLQTLLKEGNRVSLGVYACGAAGRVLVVHSVRRG
jgi:hypothetical protein